MKRGHKKDLLKKNANQLALDFTQNVPIEIHIPKNRSIDYNKEIPWRKKTTIELVRS
jgi:hypothetical protein